MKLDPVHDLQKVFRKLMSAMASPGSIADLAHEAESLDVDLHLNRGLLLVALTLLDAETSFAVVSEKSGLHGETISHMTYAKSALASNADFVFVLDGGNAAEAISSARAGTLVDPHLGATVIVEVETLTREGGVVLAGPGIETAARLRVGIDPGWIGARAAKNVEFPLGIDVIFVDSRFRAAALPRTTVVKQEA